MIRPSTDGMLIQTAFDRSKSCTLADLFTKILTNTGRTLIPTEQPFFQVEHLYLLASWVQNQVYPGLQNVLSDLT